MKTMKTIILILSLCVMNQFVNAQHGCHCKKPGWGCSTNLCMTRCALICPSFSRIGETITVEIFTEGENVDVVGTTKGKGFQGVVKRHGFHGVGGQSHGQHDRSKAPGSIGGSSYPSRVFKGMRMAGRMGNDRVKLKGLKVVKIFPEKNYILISGSVPGHNGAIVLIQK